MAIIYKLKKAFGLSEDDSLRDEGEYEPEAQESAGTGELPAAPGSAGSETEQSAPAATDCAAAAAEIFSAVVELFNSTQPDFVKECLDTEAQKSYLLERMSADLRALLEKETLAARAAGERMWRQERATLGKEVEELKRQKTVLEHKREESRSERLSAERQKRALNERVHDLENQILDLQAEKEQYQLENRSMLNKLRVAAITGSDENAALEIDRLSATNRILLDTIGDLLSKIDDLAQARIKNSGAQKKIAALTEELTRKDSRIEFLKKMQEEDADRISSLTRHSDALAAKVESLEAEVGILNETLAKNISDAAAAVESAISASGDTPRETPRKSRKERKKKKPRISAIDELIDSTDWFTAPQPEQESAPKLPKEPKEDDFGYKEPKQKQLPDDDRQLLLW